MTLATTFSRVQYAGNGATVAFSFPYRFLADADLVVYLLNASGTPQLRTISTHYTLAGEGAPTGGTVTMLVAPAAAEKLVIYRDPPVTQAVDLVENDSLPVETAVERPLDRLTMIAQFTRDKIGRALVLADGDATVDMTLPSVATLANRTLMFDAGSKPTAGPLAADITAAQTYATSAGVSASAAAASAVTAAAAAAALPIPANPGDNNKYLRASGGVYALTSPSVGGDVVGPASAGDKSLPLYDGTTGKLLKAGVALGATAHPLVSAGAGSPPAFGQLATAGIADDAITVAKLAHEGTAGHVLYSNGAGTGPGYAALTASGEANSGSNVGTGSSLFKDKAGLDLRFRSLVAGSITYTRLAGDVGQPIYELTSGTISLVQNANDVTFNLTINYKSLPTPPSPP